MATTTNFGWETPDDTDLVKDGAAAMRTLGNAIDASLVDLKGGTTGQVLSKASNTDLDYSWVTPELGDITAVTVSSPITGGGTTGSVNIAIQDGTTAQKGAVQLEDSTSSTSTTKAATPNSVKTAYDLANGAIAKSIVDAKADLITATADNTPARLAVGNDGETIVADSSATTGLRWQGNYAAGKSKIINGAFDHWQRGTSFTDPDGTYTADRFISTISGGNKGTATRQTFTAGAAPVSGYEGQYFLRYVGNNTATYMELQHRIEDVRTLANQVVTLSFWAKASSSVTFTPLLRQNFGSGGSANVDTSGSGIAFTSSWARYSVTLTLPSISGKTIGTSSYLGAFLYTSAGTVASNTVEFWGVQLEAGNTATAFQTATGTLAGELHVCKRYYEKSYNIGTTPGTNTGTGSFYYGGTTNVSNNVFFQIPFSAEKRGTPTMTFYTTSGTSGQLTYARSGVGATNATATGYQIGTTTAGVYVGAGAQYVACELGGHWVAEAEL